MAASALNSPPAHKLQARRWRIGGRVQGVGFRPFVYRLAARYGLQGWVKNRAGEVEIFAQGRKTALVRFGTALLRRAPPLSQPTVLESRPDSVRSIAVFAIEASETGGRGGVHVPPDYFTCDDCLAELHDPSNRRYRYPFINCTQCGPRYTLIERLPYDRRHTRMRDFALCPECEAEYHDPLDRRFHAEPIACPVCGPQLQFHSEDAGIVDDTAAALDACVAALQAGLIVAVKGIGGYHLVCDARNARAVGRLRLLKPRPHKPLAVLFPLAGADGLDHVRAYAQPRAGEAALLRDPMRPIVLVARRPDTDLAADIAPGLTEIGAFLPYSPLHHLLAADFGAPLVATSANARGEPVLTDNVDAEQKLARVADAWLHHDRPIERPADDAVFRVIAGRARPLRLGRGIAPLERALPFTLARPVLALGGHMKAALALAWENRIVVSPHIADLGTPRSLAVFEQVATDLQRLYGVQAQLFACDAHPGYASTRWARRRGLAALAVSHHHAHAAAVAGEFPDAGPWLVFTWDGVGLGPDRTLWGGEALVGEPGRWQRAASFRPFFLPGGEKAGREPWRSAAALCWQAGIDWAPPDSDIDLLFQAWQRRVNAPRTSAVGRLFDAAAALTGLAMTASFEGQGPMLLEAACDADLRPVALPLAETEGLWECDWAPLLPMLLDAQTPVATRAARFHASLAHALLAQARALRDRHGAFTVGLAGGVFQNRRLTELAIGLLERDGFTVRVPAEVPVNDGGLCFGQIVEAHYHQQKQV